jgi:hypothetical protein
MWSRIDARDLNQRHAVDHAVYPSVSRKQKKAAKMEIIFHFFSKSRGNGTIKGVCKTFGVEMFHFSQKIDISGTK